MYKEAELRAQERAKVPEHFGRAHDNEIYPAMFRKTKAGECTCITVVRDVCIVRSGSRESVVAGILKCSKLWMYDSGIRALSTQDHEDPMSASGPSSGRP